MHTKHKLGVMYKSTTADEENGEESDSDADKIPVES
jgi:hypothetical protein